MSGEDSWTGKRVLITGVCGTIGRELLAQLSNVPVQEVVGLDNAETNLFFLSEAYSHREHVNLCVGDIRDRDKLMRKCSGIHIVLHCAALKHVALCEREPTDPISTNILGTQNVIDAAAAAGVERVLFTSSDKAVNPTNVMGTSKLMGERLISAANAHSRADRTIYTSTRFGNVLGSRGSIVPLIHQQILAGGPVTLTHPAMTRFIMTVQEAAKLVMDSVFLARGGEVFVTKMRSVRIVDLISVMIDELSPLRGLNPAELELKVVGARAGEKMYEELLNEEELRRTIELPKYYAILPAFRALYDTVNYDYPDAISGSMSSTYTSLAEPSLPLNDLREYLRVNHLLEVN